MSTHQTAKTQFAVAPDGAKFAYRRLGTSAGTPLLILTHFRGVMDKFDPLLVNTLSASRSIILVDFAGVGLSTGEVATTVKQSAAQIIQFLGLIGEREIDLLGYSLGGFVAQLIALNADPKTLKIRKLILAGTGLSAGPDFRTTTNDLGPHVGGPEPSSGDFSVLFFPHDREGKVAVDQWWSRIHERSPQTSGEEQAEFLSHKYLDGGKGIQAQSSQIENWNSAESSKGEDGSYDRLGQLNIPVLVAQGKDDYMIPTFNSFLIQQKVPNGQLILYPNSGHGFLFQHAALFAKHALLFLEA